MVYQTNGYHHKLKSHQYFPHTSYMSSHPVAVLDLAHVFTATRRSRFNNKSLRFFTSIPWLYNIHKFVRVYCRNGSLAKMTTFIIFVNYISKLAFLFSAKP